MLTLLGSLLGFLGSAFPSVLKLFQDKRDKAHELALLQLQMEAQTKQGGQRLEEIQIASQAAEMQALYASIQPTNVPWVDALNGTVRPVIAYAFFALYAAIKLSAIGTHGLYPENIWTEEDPALFAGIVSFYFGQRALRVK